jgi:uncharacterized protein YcaQ
MQVFDRFGSIQFDPIAVAGRNHDLVLHARVAGYEPAWCDALYERQHPTSQRSSGSFSPAREYGRYWLGSGGR